MNSPSLSWIPLDRIHSLVQLEPALVLLGLGAAAWVIYKLFLREVSEDRHRFLRSRFLNLLGHAALAAVAFLLYRFLDRLPETAEHARRLIPYAGFLCIIWGSVFFVKTCSVLLFEYLFLGHMREGVPVLFVNLFSLLLSLVLAGWIVTELFSVRITPLLATSAIFSIVLGLALQDTLGNLFAGIALQIDKPYEIGDWIEIQSGSQKWCGQVHEITWRATVLTGFSDEALTVPNRVMAQAEISNFSAKTKPIIRSQSFRIPHGTSVSHTKTLLLNAATQVALIRRDPEPTVLVTETTDSWMTFKLIYFVDDYGSQFKITDQVITAATDALQANGIQLAANRLLLLQPRAEAPPAIE